MSDEKELVVSRTINAPSNEIFDVLTLPARHKDFDGLGYIVSDDRTNRIQKVGDVFAMNMHNDRRGDYVMDNHVIAFVENKVVGWAPALEGEDEPRGWTYVYTLEPLGPSETEVTLTYDWSDVKESTDLPKFPPFDAATLEESLNLLAATVS